MLVNQNTTFTFYQLTCLPAEFGATEKGKEYMENIHKKKNEVNEAMKELKKHWAGRNENPLAAGTKFAFLLMFRMF